MATGNDRTNPFSYLLHVRTDEGDTKQVLGGFSLSDEEVRLQTVKQLRVIPVTERGGELALKNRLKLARDCLETL